MWLYAGSATSKHRALEESLTKVKSWSKHWERKAKEGMKKIMSMEKERDEAKEEAQVARLVAVSTGDAKVKAKGDLTRV